MIKVLYEYPVRSGKKVKHLYKCVTDKQAENVLNMVKERKEAGYRLISITRK